MPSAECGGFRGVAGGKFLVLRRDGSVPDWTWFVLGAADPSAPVALRAYAGDAIVKACDMVGDHGETCPEMLSKVAYGQHVDRLAHDFDRERRDREAAGRKKGDPEAPPHRVDDPLVLALMRGEVTWPQVRSAWEMARGFDDLRDRAEARARRNEQAQDDAALGIHRRST